MRKRVFLIGGAIFLVLLLILYQLYYSRPPEEVRPEIDNSIDVQYSNQFDIVKIETHYSQDLFHQPNGYNIWLKDKFGLAFGPVPVQLNPTQKRWITIGGYDIGDEYKKVKSKNQEDVPRQQTN
jgi:hypothetical protein